MKLEPLRGERNRNAKLSWSVVADLLNRLPAARFERGPYYKAEACRLGVHPGTVAKACRGATW